jgi:negative regulator of sigma-B (phosphoserine phosphatase)
MRLSVGWATRPCDGQRVNGDAVVARLESDADLIAVVDGLGHGERAAEAAEMARHQLRTAPLQFGIEAILDGLHHALKGTRGAAAMVCVVANGRISGCGVGNVEMRINRGSLPIVLSPGILGVNVRKFRFFEGKLSPGDRLLLFSDGITPDVHLEDLGRHGPAEASQWILTRHRRTHDDATVMVVDIEA